MDAKRSRLPRRQPRRETSTPKDIHAKYVELLEKYSALQEQHQELWRQYHALLDTAGDEDETEDETEALGEELSDLQQRYGDLYDAIARLDPRDLLTLSDLDKAHLARVLHQASNYLQRQAAHGSADCDRCGEEEERDGSSRSPDTL